MPALVIPFVATPLFLSSSVRPCVRATANIHRLVVMTMAMLTIVGGMMMMLMTMVTMTKKFMIVLIMFC